MKRFFALAACAAVGLSASVAWAQTVTPYSNGFENAADVSISTDGSYPDLLAFYTVTRVPSGTGGVDSALGSWHAEAAWTSFGSPDGFVFTRYGGYQTVFPEGGWGTSVDIYLNPNDSPDGADITFSWTSGVSSTTNGVLRDFVFNVGTDGVGGFVISASNNNNGIPSDPAQDPIWVVGGEWYTFAHQFYDDGNGVLAVDMTVFDSNDTVLKTWTLSNPADVIGVNVGGNRYGWLVTNFFDNLALDNVMLFPVEVVSEPGDKGSCTGGGWMDLARADGTPFKNQGDCIQYVNKGK